MNVNLYLHKDTFCYNGIDSYNEFMQKLQSLTGDLSLIKSSKSCNAPHIFISSSLNEIKVFKDRDILNVASELGHEESILLYSILGNTSDICNKPLEDVKEMCKYRSDEEECNTIVFLNKPVCDETPISTQPYMQFDSYEIIYNYQNWTTLERQILGNHPENPEHFYCECIRLFPNLYFHKNCENTLPEVYDKVPRAIVYHLSCLNDKFKNFLNSTKNKQANDILMQFAGKYHLCEGSLNRSDEFKKKLTFDFPITEECKKFKKEYCDPHYKLDNYDDNYQGRKESNGKLYARIYFFFGDEEVLNGRILIGWIGKHA